MAEVRFSRRAMADLARAHAWLAERNPAAAGRVITAIETTAALLADNPAMGRPENRGLGRVLVVPRYRYVLIYRLNGETVEILYLFHPSQAR